MTPKENLVGRMCGIEAHMSDIKDELKEIKYAIDNKCAGKWVEKLIIPTIVGIILAVIGVVI